MTIYFGELTYLTGDDSKQMDGKLLYLSRRVFVVLAIATLYVLAVLLMWYVSDILLLAFASILFAIFLHGNAEKLSERTPLDANWALVVVTVLLVAASALAVWLLGAPIAQEMEELRSAIPTSTAEWEKILGQYGWGQMILKQVESMPSVFPRGSALASRIGQFFSNTLYIFTSALVVFIAGIYFASQPKTYTEGLVQFVPEGARDAWRNTLDALRTTLWWWLIGRMILMAVNGILTMIGLWIIGVPLAVALGILAGFLNFIPNIGPWIGAIPAILIGLSQGPDIALYVILLYILLQSIDGYLFTPLVDQRSVCLPAAIVIFAQLTFGYLFGFLGLLLATPLTAAITVILKLNYLHHGEQKGAEALQCQ